jgi:hypothetical protein
MEPYIFKSLLHHFRTGADEYLKEYEKNHTQNKIHALAITMAKPTARSTVSAMKDYIRANRLNKAPIRLGMKREELIAGLRKLGHWDAQHDGAPAPRRKPPAPKKPVPKVPKAPAPPPKRARVVAGPVDLQGDRQDPGEGDRGEVRSVQKQRCDDQMREAKNYIELDERRYTKPAMKYAGSDDNGSHFKQILDFANYDRNVIRIRNVCGIDHANTYQKAYAIYKKNGDKYIPDKKPKAPKKPKAIEDKAPAKKEAPAGGDTAEIKRLLKAKNITLDNVIKPTASRPYISTKVQLNLPQGTELTIQKAVPTIEAINKAIPKKLLDQGFRVLFYTMYSKGEVMYDFKPASEGVVYTVDEKGVKRAGVVEEMRIKKQKLMARRNPPAPKAPRAPAPKKEEVDRIERTKLTREFQREHKKSVWQILTLKPTATREAVKARGRELMRKHHPDKGGDKATFQRVQQAVKLLMDTFGPVQ